MSTSTMLSQYSIANISDSNEGRERKKEQQNWKGGNQNTHISGDMILYVDKVKYSIKKFGRRNKPIQ